MLMRHKNSILPGLIASLVLSGTLQAQWGWEPVLPSVFQGYRGLAVIGTQIFAGNLGAGVFRSTDLGQTWTAVDSGLTTTEVTSLAVVDGTIFAGTYAGYLGGRVFRSDDNGGFWSEVGVGLPNTGVRNLAVNGGRLYAAMYNSGIFVSTDKGTSWTSANNGLGSSYHWVVSADSAAVLAASDSALFRSTDQGLTWVRLNTGINFGPVAVTALLAQGPLSFAATVNGGIWRSTDNGVRWSMHNIFPPSASVYSIARVNHMLFCGDGAVGVSASTDNGASWFSANYGLIVHSYGYPSAFCFAELGGYVYASFYTIGAYDEGLWRRRLIEIPTNVQPPPAREPRTYALQQNFPNPFNSSTSISIALPSPQFTELTIIDPLGRNISTLVSRELSIGTHTFRWHADNMPSGVYFYRVQTPTFSQTRPMILLR